MNKKIYILIAIFWLCQLGVAQTYSVSPSFNVQNEGTLNGTGVISDVIYGIIPEAGNKYLIYGSFSGYRGFTNRKLARINADGSPDLSFNTGTVGPNFLVYTADIQTDGKYIIGGNFTTFQGVSSIGIARLNSDGSLDNSFNVGSGFNFTVSKVMVLNSGKILVGGDFTNYNGQAVSGLVRLNTDGSLDTTFTTVVTQVNFNTIRDMVELNDGKLIVAGTFTSFNGQSVGRIVKLNPDGSTDTSFNNSQIGANNIINDIELLPDGKMYIAGLFGGFNGNIARKIARLNTDGSFDATFSLDSNTNPDDEIFKVNLLSNGKIAIGGRFNNIGNLSIDAFAVLNDNGTLHSYLLNTKLGDIRYMVEDSNQNILLVGNFQKYDNYFAHDIVQIDSNYQVNENFNIGGKGIGAFTTVTQILPVQNDKFILSGTFKSYDNYEANKIARINSDGSFDNTFNIGVFDFISNNGIRKVFEKSNGNLLIAGSFSSYNGNTNNRNMIEIDNNGDILPVFNANLFVGNEVRDFEVLSTGSIIIAGGFSGVNNIARNRIAIINADGTLDPIFDPSVGANNAIYKVKFYNNKIYVAGAFNQWNNAPVGFMVRLNLDGTLDTNFNAKFGFDVNDFIFQPDGKIVAVGNFQTYDGTNVGYITRIHTNGDLDTSFKPMGTGGTSQIQTIVIQNDGKFIIGGNFNMFNNQNISKLIRLNSDGTIDNSFVLPNWVTGTSVDAVLPILNTTTNELDYIVGGNYRSIGGVNKNGFAKINSNASLSNNEVSFEAQANIVVYPNPTRDIVNLKTERTSFIIQVVDVSGKELLKLKNVKTFSLEKYASGLYFVHITDENSSFKETIKVVKN